MAANNFVKHEICSKLLFSIASIPVKPPENSTIYGNNVIKLLQQIVLKPKALFSVYVTEVILYAIYIQN